MKQHGDRILFLKQFAKELIIQSKPSDYIEAIQTEEEKIGEGEFIPLVPITEETKPEFLKQSRTASNIQVRKSRYRIRTIEPIRARAMQAIQPKHLIARTSRQLSASEIIPQPEPTSETIDLGKLNFLIQDPRVTIIECPGPEKLVMAKMHGNPTMTKISLNEQEIQEIVDNFSQRAKIPVISGLFKAAVGNLIITAVISELIGNRFIIQKLTPQFILESRAY